MTAIVLALGLVVYALVVTRLFGLAGLLVVLIMFGPYVAIFDITLRLEHLLLPLLALLGGAMIPVRLALARVVRSYVYLWTWFVIVTIFGSVVLISRAHLLSSALYLRPVGGMLAGLALVYSRKAVPWSSNFVRAFVTSAVPMTILTFGQVMDWPGLSELTLQHYQSAARTAVSSLVGMSGLVLRGVGTLESPPYAGFYFALVLVAALQLVHDSDSEAKGTRFLMWLSVASSIAGGILTQSSTFLALLPLAALITFIGPGRTWRFGTGLGLAAVATTTSLLLVLFLGNANPRIGTNLGYSANRLSGEVFDTRFGHQGSLQGAMEGVVARPLTGWGWTRMDEVLVGDSLYLVVAFLGGLIGIALLMWLILSVWRMHNRLLNAWGLLFLMAGVGIPTIWLPRVGDIWWLLIGITLATQEKTLPVEKPRARSGLSYDGSPVSSESLRLTRT